MFDQDLFKDLWYDLKKLLWQDELNPRVRCAFGNVWKSAPHLFQEEVRMIVKTSMHTPDIIITDGTDMKVHFRFYDEVMQSNVMEKLYIFACFFDQSI